MKKFKLGLLMLTMAGAFSLFTGCGAKKIDLNDYVTYEFKGYDGYGMVTKHFDTEAFEEDLGDLDDEEFYGMGALAIESVIDGDFEDDNHSLSNGDKIEFKWDISDNDAKAVKQKLKVNLKYSDFSAKVEGLTDPSEFDIAEHLTIDVSGYAPNGKLSVSTNLTGFDVKADKSTELSNVDEVTITIAPKQLDQTMEEVCAANYIPVFDGEYKYTVEGLHSYVTTAAEIPTDVLDIMKTKGEEIIKDNQEDSCDCDTSLYPEFVDHKNFDTYELVAIGVTPYSNSNRVYLIYKTNYSVHGDVETYNAVYFDGVVDSNEGLTDADIRGNFLKETNQIEGRYYYGAPSIEQLNKDLQDYVSKDINLTIEEL